jgi:hypothetical protein
VQRPEKTETSLALVPKDHPQLKITNIEGETSGLLDRILGVLQEETRLDERAIGGSLTLVVTFSSCSPPSTASGR